MNFPKIILVFLLPILGACAELQHIRDSVAKTDATNDSGVADHVNSALVFEGNEGVYAWLADLHNLRTRPAESMDAVMQAREQAFRSTPSLENRMRLVMLLLVDAESVRDSKRARLLLGGIDPLPSMTREREFIVLLKQFLDGQKEYEQKLSVLWKQVTQQNQRIDELEQQLKALTSIEQNIQQRGTPPVTEDGK